MAESSRDSVTGLLERRAPSSVLFLGVAIACLSCAQPSAQRTDSHFSPRPGGSLKLTNRSHGLDGEITPQGLDLRSIHGDETAHLTLRLGSLGRGGASMPVGAGHVRLDGDRAEIARETIVEWLRSDYRGIEHGFTLPLPPPGSSGWVTIELEVGGTARPLSSGEGSIDIVSGGDIFLRYGGLTVLDSSGREVPSRLATLDDRIRILIDDHDALYPLLVDPLMTSPAWSAQVNQPGASLGYSVASAGDVNGDGYDDLILGAPGYDNGETNEGRAYLYLGSRDGLLPGPSWVTEGNQEDAALGIAVASAGDVNGDGRDDVIIGAYRHDNPQTDEGRVMIFAGSDAGLEREPLWVAEGNTENALLGIAVASAGDVDGDGYDDVLVGARFGGPDPESEGRVFLYMGSPDGPSTSPSWNYSSGQPGSGVGASASGAGDVNGDGYDDVVIGAYQYDSGEPDGGRALLFTGSESGLSASPAWIADSDRAGASFGRSVAGAGDVNGDGYDDVVVGAYRHSGGQTWEGRSYLYLGSDIGLTAAPSWATESDQQGSLYGWSVSSAGDINGDGFSDVAIGASAFEAGETNEGRAYVFVGSGTGLEVTPEWTSESDQIGAEFGFSVASAGDVNGDGFDDVAVGARSYDDSETDEGRVVVFMGSASGLITGPAWTSESDQTGANLGVSVASAGDVDGDGYDDVVIGAYSYDHGELDEGRAFLHAGSASGLSAEPVWTGEGDQPAALFGYSVASAGDVNGDSYDDVIVGAYRYSNGATQEGAAFLYHGSPQGLSATPDWTAEGEKLSAQFGWSVASAGDVNGDGFDDVIIGAVTLDNGQPQEGGAIVYLGSATGLEASPHWSVEGDQEAALMGISVASAGDVNGDGFADVIVGAYLHDAGRIDEGRAFVYLGSARGLASRPVWVADGEQERANFGISVASAGDVNADGFDDILVGAHHHDSGEFDEGAAYLYLGSPRGPYPSPSWTGHGDQADAEYGLSVAGVGDVNGDGHDDVAVGAYYYDNGQDNEGRVFFYLGSDGAGLAKVAAWTAESNQAGSNFGISVAGAGDVDGDGFADVLIGAYHFDNGHFDEGRVFLYRGSPTGLGRAEEQ